MKKIFGWGFQFFVSDVISGGVGQTWPTSRGPGPKPSDRNILVNFLLETRLQSESFDTLDDLLRFGVQKL